MINIIGPIVKLADPTAEVLVAVTVPGYHVNSSEPLSIPDNYRVNPATPEQSFVSESNYYYRFENEAQARSFGIIQEEQ